LPTRTDFISLAGLVPDDHDANLDPIEADSR
jgi:hypothetical protein